MANNEMTSKINRSNYLRAYCEPARTNRHNIVIATLKKALLWSFCVKLEQAKTKKKSAIKTMEKEIKGKQM